MTGPSGRERILREAMRLFGENGVSGSSVRAVAAAADVSPATVMHHFGTKQGLRHAVDDRLLEGYRDLLTAAARALLAEGPAPDPSALMADPVARGYLRRALLDGGPEPTALLTAVVAVVRDNLATLADQGRTPVGADLDYAAVQVVALLLGPVVLGPLLPGFEAAAAAAGTVQRRSSADVALLQRGLIRPDLP